MGDYNNLLEKTFKEGVAVVEIDLGTDTPCGKCIGNTIYINDRATTNEKRCVLAEELGHYHLTIGDITDLKDINNKKQELKARRYGYKLLIDPDDIVNAMKDGCNNRFEIADYLNISEEFLEDLIEDYKRLYGLGVLIGNYYLQLEPTLGLIRDLGGLFDYKNK
ncbi:ImmA/IrrE family metallo-endopeptidase [Clostridium paraputrificum]|uniref:ImmA/IrrE family metallo-endopeptidase n=1 Tax=Clostridium paraputrificum TaxID=29363 RepID=UPI00066575B2|nr:ImmA/IrrE family metallo-endopeptidase [Clostridium paraputrificum]